MNSIYEYSDYRVFLRDFYEEKKKKTRHFTFRYFAQKAGLGSPMHLKLVMEGARNLSHKTIPKFSSGLGLKNDEADFFQSLVYFCQAQDPSERLGFWRKLEQSRGKRKSRKADSSEQLSLFSKWFYPIVYELTNQKDFQEDPVWISRELRDAIRPAEAKEALKKLEDSGLLVRDAQQRLRPAELYLKTDDEIENLMIRDYHRQMMEFAAKRIDDPIAQREFGFVTVSTTRERFDQFKKAIKEFVTSANIELTAPEKEGELVCELNVQFFQLSGKQPG